jgi:hypothetical protein
MVIEMHENGTMEGGPYSPTTVLTTWQYGSTNKQLAGKQFATDTNVKQAVTSWLHTPDNDFHFTRI